VEYVAWETKLNTPDKDGVTLRSMQEERLRRNLPGAREALEGPMFPLDMEHIYLWNQELFGRSGIGMSGVAPLSYGAISDWSRLTGNSPEPDEIQALLRLDAVMRHPPEDKPVDAKPEPTASVPLPAWPEKKKNA
jgi:hypothetical protein